MQEDRARTLAQLRQQIARIAGPPPPPRRSLATGDAALDGALGGGWPLPGLVEISGPTGSGRVEPALRTCAALTRAGRPVAVVDPMGLIYPPGWTGVVLERLLIVQPAPEQAAWAAEQLARSGNFPFTLLLTPPPLGRAGARLARAVEEGEGVLMVALERPDPRLPATLRLEARGHDGGWRLAILRARGGLAERSVLLR